MKQFVFLTVFLLVFCACNKNDFARVYLIQPTDISRTTITCGGYLEVEKGNPQIQSCGIVYSLEPDPIIDNDLYVVADSVVQDGVFKCQLTDLIPDTTYYLTAFATWNNNTHYSLGQIATVRTTYNMGHSGPAGGIIVYLQPDSLHGIEISPENLPSSTWGCHGLDMPGTETFLFTGQDNTTVILNGCPDTPTAASVCNDYTLNGYDDWFLPSITELEMAYFNYFSGKGTFGLYSSSSQYSPTATRSIIMTDGSVGYTSKTNKCSIRAARYF